MLEKQSELATPASIQLFPCSDWLIYTLLGCFGIPPHLVVGHPSSVLGRFLSSFALISLVGLIYIKWASCSESARAAGTGVNFAVVFSKL